MAEDDAGPVVESAADIVHAEHVAAWPHHTPRSSRSRGRDKLPPFNPQPVVFDFDVEPPPTEWLVKGLVPAHGVTLFTGDTATGKTFLGLDLARAVLQGGQWLGRDVRQGSVIVVDAENSKGNIHRRLRALSVVADDLAQLQYYLGSNAQVGDGARHDEWIAGVLAEASNPRLLTLDTAMSSTALTEVNDNSVVTRLLTRIGTIAKAHGCAVLLMHHTRKPQQGQGGGRAAQVLGAGQWRAQAECHIAISKANGDKELSTDEDGTVHSAFELDLTVEKMRDGVEPRPQRVRVETMSHDDRLQTVVVTATDAPRRSEDPARMTKSEHMQEAIRDALRERPMNSRDLGLKVGADHLGSTFKRARGGLVEAGVIAENEAKEWTMLPDPEPEI
jgi:hypothetical protein